MIDSIKALLIGLAVIAAFVLFFLAIFAGGFFSYIVLITATVACSYFIGSVILDLHRSNKKWEEKYSEGS
jgi:ABC-type multidrug transport system permease subunit